MITAENALGPIFLIILFGSVLGNLGFPDTRFWDQAGRLIYYLFFPALLIHTLAKTDFGAVNVAAPALITLGSTLAVAACLWGLRTPINSGAARFTSIFQGALRFNTYIAIAASAGLYGANGTALAAVIIAIMVPAINVFCVLCFVRSGLGTDSGRRSGLTELARNPLIVACVIGLFINLTGIGLPGWTAQIAESLGTAALPLALLTVGAALRLNQLLHINWTFWLTTTVKLILLPSLALAFCGLAGLDTTSRGVVIIFMAMPTASSAYILALELGGDSDLMAALITGQTLLAMLTLPLWLAIVT